LFGRTGQENRLSENPGMTTEELYRVFYGTFVPVLHIMATNIGRDKMVKELARASAENGRQMIAAMAKEVPKRDLKAFAGLIAGWMAAPPFNKAFASEVVESSDRVLEVKYTQCLPAKMWREMNAADLGYALECSSSDAMVKAFNPAMTAASIKNMMKGDSVCIERFEMA
jgi:hypothetical protein